jgi:hypothetical protein
LLSARGEILRKLKARHPFVEDGILLSKLVMYTSKLVSIYQKSMVLLEICNLTKNEGSLLCGESWNDSHGENKTPRHRREFLDERLYGREGNQGRS